MKKIGFIGAGNMATAIIKGIMAQNNNNSDFINVFDVSVEKCEFMQSLGVNVFKSGSEVVENSDIIVLAVKPQNYAEVLEQLSASVDESKTFVSIAAGISIAYVQNALKCNAQHTFASKKRCVSALSF